MKKTLLILALLTASQALPYWGGGWGGYGPGYYGGWGYGPGYYGGGYYNNAGAGIVAGSNLLGAAMIAGSRPKSDAEVDAQERRNDRRAIERQIRDLKKDIRSAQKHNDDATVKDLNKQLAELRNSLANG